MAWKGREWRHCDVIACEYVSGVVRRASEAWGGGRRRLNLTRSQRSLATLATVVSEVTSTSVLWTAHTGEAIALAVEDLIVAIVEA